MGMSRQAVSQHLERLEAASLVVTLWQGREKLHYLNPAPLHEIAMRWLARFDQRQLQALSEMKRRLEGKGDLP